MKTSLEEFKGRFEQREERASEAGDRTVQIIESEGHKEKRSKKSKQRLKGQHAQCGSSWTGEREEAGNVFEEIMA